MSRRGRILVCNASFFWPELKRVSVPSGHFGTSKHRREGMVALAGLGQRASYYIKTKEEDLWILVTLTGSGVT